MVVDSWPQRHSYFSKCDPSTSKHATTQQPSEVHCQQCSHPWLISYSISILVGNTSEFASWCLVTATARFSCGPTTHQPCLSSPLLFCTTALLLFYSSPSTFSHGSTTIGSIFSFADLIRCAILNQFDFRQTDWTEILAFHMEGPTVSCNCPPGWLPKMS